MMLSDKLNINLTSRFITQGLGWESRFQLRSQVDRPLACRVFVIVSSLTFPVRKLIYSWLRVVRVCPVYCSPNKQIPAVECSCRKKLPRKPNIHLIGSTSNYWCQRGCVANHILWFSQTGKAVYNYVLWTDRIVWRY